MAITIVGSEPGSGGTGSVTVSLPAEVADGDLLILGIEGEGEDTSADSPPTGGAWNTIGSVASATDGAVDRTRCSVYWAWYTEGINLTVPDAGNHTIAQVWVFRGVDETTPLDGVTPSSGSSSSNSTSHSAVTGISSATNNAMAVLIYSHGDGSGTNPTGFTNASLASANDGTYISNDSGSDGTVGCIYGIKTTAGSLGTYSWSTSSTEENAWWAFALRPSTTQPITPAAKTITVTPGSLTITGGSSTENGYILAGSDDGHIDGVDFYNSSTGQWAGNAAGDEAIWWRFDTVGVPDTGDVVITSAKISLYFQSHSLTDPPSGDAVGFIAAQDADDPAAFDSYSGGTTPYASRTPTTATASWSLSASWSDGQWVDSSDITSIIEELIARPGWVDGGGMLFWWEPTSVGDDDEWQFDTYEGTNSAVLTITYYIDSGVLDITPAAKTITVTAGTMTVTTGPVDITPSVTTVNITPGVLTVTTGPVNITPAAVTATVTPGTMTVTTGPVDITPAATTVTVTAGTVTVENEAAQAITPAAVTVTVTAGTATVTPGDVAITPDGPTVTVTAGTVTVVTDQPVSPVGPTVTVTAGSATVTPGPVDITPAAETVTVTAGTVTVTATYDISLDGPTVTVTAGAATVTPGTVDITPAATTVTVTAGATTITPGPVDITPAATTVTVTAGTVTVTTSYDISLDAPTVTVTPGSATVTPGTADITPAAKTVTVTAGSLNVALGSGVQDVIPAAVTVTATPGTVTLNMDIPVSGPTVTVTAGTPTLGGNIDPDAVTVTVTPGDATITAGAVDITPAATTVTVTAGTVTVTAGATPITPADVTVTVTAGSMTVTAGAVDITPTDVTVTVTAGTVTVAAESGATQDITPDPTIVTVTAGTATLGGNIDPDGATVTVTPGALNLGIDTYLSLDGPTVTVTAGTATVEPLWDITPTAVTVTVTAGTAQIDAAPAVDLEHAVVSVLAGTPTVGIPGFLGKGWDHARFERWHQWKDIVTKGGAEPASFTISGNDSFILTTGGASSQTTYARAESVRKWTEGELAFTYYLEPGDAGGFYLVYRHNGEWTPRPAQRQTPTTGYSLYINTSGNMGIERWDAGVSTPISNAAFLAIPAGQSWNMKLSVNGADMKAKAWQVEDDEPDWQVSATDDTYTDTGLAFFGEDVSSSSTYTITNIDIAAHTPNNTVVLATGLSRGGLTPFRPVEGWHQASDVFAVPAGMKNAATQTVASTVLNNMSVTDKVMQDLVNQVLNDAGYRQASGAFVGASEMPSDKSFTLDPASIRVVAHTPIITPGAAAVTPAAVSVTATAGSVDVDASPTQAIVPAAKTITVTPSTMILTPVTYSITPAAKTVHATAGSVTVANQGSSWGDGVSFMARPASTQLIYQGQSNFVIENKSFYNIPFDTQNPSNDHVCIMLIDCTNVTVRYCDFDTIGQPFAIFGGTNITVEWCRARNITGPSERYDTQNGNFLQTVNGPSYVTVQDCKIVGGDTEDIISLFSATNSVVQRCHIQGARADVIDGGWTSTSGTGIIVGDGGGSDCDVLDNTLYLPGQVGIGIAGGTNMTIDGNTIKQPSQLPRASSNVGIYAINYAGGSWGGHVVSNNNVRLWSDSENVWNGDYDGEGTGTTWTGNNFNDSSLDSADLSVTL